MSSCASSKKASETPDDVYYSPGARSAAVASGEQSEYYSTAPSDQYVRMKAHNYSRWSYFDDYNAYDSYYASPVIGVGGYYGYGYGYPYYTSAWGFGPSYGPGLSIWDPYLSWNSYYMWNSWYNPYFYNPYYGGGAIIVNSKAPVTNNVYTHLRSFNGVSYRNGLPTTSSGSSGGGRFYRPSVSQSYVPGARTNNNTYYRPSVSTNNGSFNNGSYNRPSYNPQPSYNTQPVRSYSPAPSMGSGGGGISRPGIRH